MGVDAAQVAVQLKAGRLRRRAGDSERYAQDRVCAQVCLVGRAVRGDQGGVDRTLIKGVHTDHGVRALLVHMVDGLGNALAQIAIAIAIAQLNGLESTGGSAGGHHRTAKGAIIEHNFHLNSGIAARVQDLATVHIENLSLDTRASDPAEILPGEGLDLDNFFSMPERGPTMHGKLRNQKIQQCCNALA